MDSSHGCATTYFSHRKSHCQKRTFGIQPQARYCLLFASKCSFPTRNSRKLAAGTTLFTFPVEKPISGKEPSESCRSHATFYISRPKTLGKKLSESKLSYATVYFCLENSLPAMNLRNLDADIPLLSRKAYSRVGNPDKKPSQLCRSHATVYFHVEKLTPGKKPSYSSLSHATVFFFQPHSGILLYTFCIEKQTFGMKSSESSRGLARFCVEKRIPDKEPSESTR